MRDGVAGLALGLALACSACGAPQLSLSTGGTRGWSDFELGALVPVEARDLARPRQPPSP